MADSRPIVNKTTQDGSPPPGDGGSLGDSVMGIIKDVQNVIRGEVLLAKTEIKEEATQMGKGAGMIGAGVFFALIGFIFLMLALTYVINQWLELWLSALIVGAALVIIAAILAMSGKNQIQSASLKPEQTIESLKEDQQWASQQIKSVKK